MPDPSRLLHTLREAVKAFRATPGRTGRVTTLTNAREILIAGDLHGNVENFRLLLKRAALDATPERHLVLQEVIHGRFFYPNGGDKSHQLLDLTAALKCQYPERVHFLLGNHELAQWQDQLIGKADLDLNMLFKQGVATAYGERADQVYAAYLDLFAAADLAVRTTNRIFMSHSLPSGKRLEHFDPADIEREELRPDDVALGGSVHALVWGRDTRLETVAEFLKKVDADLLITGHIPCEKGYDTPSERQLILDSLGTPACYCLFPTDRPLTMSDLLGYVGTLQERSPEKMTRIMHTDHTPAPSPESVLDQLGPAIHEKVIVENREFTIARPSQSDRLLDLPAVHEAFKQDEYMPYWADLWPAARMLAKAILRENWAAGQETLEIGCGLGLPGIVALSAGLRVTFSDYDPCALRFAADNARLNGFDEFKTLLLDWRHPPAELRVPILFAADLVYEVRNVEPLVRFIRQVLAPDGLCLLTDQDRVPAQALRDSLAGEGLEYTTQLVRAGEPGGRRLKGTLYRIRRA